MDILLHNCSTIIKSKKFNIDTILFKFHQLSHKSLTAPSSPSSGSNPRPSTACSSHVCVLSNLAPPQKESVLIPSLCKWLFTCSNLLFHLSWLLLNGLCINLAHLLLNLFLSILSFLLPLSMGFFHYHYGCNQLLLAYTNTVEVLFYVLPPF